MSQRDRNECSRFPFLWVLLFLTVNYHVQYYGGKLKRSAITHILFFPIEEDTGYFQIDAVSGELRTTRSLSHAERSDYRMMVTARDQGMPSLQGHAAVYIQVLVYVVRIEQLC